MMARRARLQSVIAMQAASAGNDPLEVRDVRAYPLREPGSGRRYTALKLTARSGMVGWGECGDITRREFDAAKQAVVGTPGSAYEIAFRKLAAMPAIRAGIDMAMLDMLGKAAKAPVYQVLGGPTRAKARALAPFEGRAALERAQAAGFRAFSIPVPAAPFRNQGKSYMNRIVNLAAMMRNAAAPGTDFVLDGRAALTPGDAQSVAAELESMHFLWFDEPSPSLNTGALKKITAETVMPLGLGRSLADAAGFQDLLGSDAVDILRPNLALHGISHCRRIAAIAEVYYVAVAPYHDGGPIATAAALHLAASIPNFFIQQIPQPDAESDREMRKAIAGADVETVRDGFAALPTGPGLGIAVDERALERYKEAA